MINKIETLGMTENMEVDMADVKIEEAPVIVQTTKLNHAVVTKPIANRHIPPSNPVKKSCSSKKLGKDSPRKVLPTKGVYSQKTLGIYF